MAAIKQILKILILVELLACTLAFYGHPDAEFIDFGSPSQQSRDQMIIEAAIKRGMDGEAVAELLRTHKPVVRTITNPSGFTKTTTYKLEPDGSISSKSILQKRTRYFHKSDSIPDELKNTPTGTVTRTFTDSDGNKVTQTIAMNRGQSAPVEDKEGNLNEDWYGKPFASWPEDTLSSPQFLTKHRTVSRTFTSPQGERTTLQSWSSTPESPFTLKNNTPNFRTTSTRTFTKPSGEKHVIQTTATNSDTSDTNHKPKFPPHWPSFDDPSFSLPWDTMGPADDDEGWEVIDDPEVTTKKNIKSWTPKTWEWPEFPTHPTTQATTTTSTVPTSTTRKPLPSLDEFLKNQYGSSANRETTTSTSKAITYTPKYETTTTPKSSTTTPKFIKIEDLPVVEVLHNGKPASENILKALPAHLTPRTPPETVLNIEHLHPVEDDIDSYTPKVETNTRIYSKTHIGPEKPRLKDLDPQMQDILKNAGIVPEIEGDSVTKTRKESDGRVITTTYKVSTVPSPPIAYVPTMQHYMPRHFSPYPLSVPLQPLVPSLSPITDFLARLGLTRFDITSRNGHYSKTLIDENGDVLTATFVLTSSSNKAGGRK